MDSACAQEQQRLEERMAERMKQPGAQGGPHRLPQRGQDQPYTNADEHDADVLDAMEGQHALEVVLHERVQHAQNRRQQPERQDPTRQGRHGARPRSGGASHTRQLSASPRTSASRRGWAQLGGRAGAILAAESRPLWFHTLPVRAGTPRRARLGPAQRRRYADWRSPRRLRRRAAQAQRPPRTRYPDGSSPGTRIRRASRRPSHARGPLANTRQRPSTLTPAGSRTPRQPAGPPP